MDRYADEDVDGKYQDGLEEKEEKEDKEVAEPAKKLAKLDDEDANENDDGKALADEGYSYVRELEYQDGLMKTDEEEDDEEEDDEEAEPAKKPVKLGDTESDEEDDSEDQPAQELEEKDADGGDEEVHQPAISARPDAWVDDIPFYIRGEVGDEVNLPPGRLAEIEDMRKHLMQVRKAAEARESRRSDNVAGLLWPTFRHCGHPPTAPAQPPAEADVEQPKATMQQAVDEVEKMYLQEGFVFRRNVLARNIGVHPSNRACTGHTPANAQRLMLTILKQGYSETSSRSEAGKLRAEQQAFTPPQYRSSVSCSHTAAILNSLTEAQRRL
jgi:hypothetical protein